MKLTNNMKAKIADKIKSELKRKSGHDFTVIVLHHETITIHIGPYNSATHRHSYNMHMWMELNPLLLSEIVQKSCDFQWHRSGDTWTIETGIIEYFDTWEDDHGKDHELQAFYTWNSESGEFGFIGDYDNEKPCCIEWDHEDAFYEFEKEIPDYVKKDIEKKITHKTECEFIQEYGVDNETRKCL